MCVSLTAESFKDLADGLVPLPVRPLLLPPRVGDREAAAARPQAVRDLKAVERFK